MEDPLPNKGKEVEPLRETSSFFATAGRHSNTIGTIAFLLLISFGLEKLTQATKFENVWWVKNIIYVADLGAFVQFSIVVYFETLTVLSEHRANYQRRFGKVEKGEEES